MKALVMEINKDRMILMKSDSTFVNVKYMPGVNIGDEITVPEKQFYWRNVYKSISVAAAIIMMLIGGLQVKTYYTPYGYMNIDINPSVELAYNKYERIIGIKGLNDDGEKIVQHIEDIKNKRIEEGVKNIVEAASNENYLIGESDNAIMLSLYSPDSSKGDKLKEKVNNSVNVYLSSNNKKAELINETVTKEEIDRAALQKVTIGKLKLYEKVKQTNPNISLEEIKNKPVKEIIKIIKENKTDNKKDSNNNEKLNEKINRNEKLKEIIKNNETRKSNILPQKPDNPNLVPNININKPNINNRIDDIINNNKERVEQKNNTGKPSSEKNAPLQNSNQRINSSDRVNERIEKVKERIEEIEGRRNR